jgi:dTDP-4-dehydrorhamnose reductase
VVGLAGLVEQAWQRYRRAIAITECHHGTTRDEQARWFIETWGVAEALRENGADLRAVTAWSLLGSHDWNRMVTRESGHYEPGVFDVRSGTPRPTLMARVLQDLSVGRCPADPGLDVPGWWRDERRARSSGFALNGPLRDVGGPAPLLIVGKDDALFDLATKACEARGLHYLRAAELDERAIATARPWAILDIRGWQGASRAREPELAAVCRRFDVQGAVVRAHDPRVLPAATSEDLLVAATGPVFFPSDDAGLAARILDALDRHGDAVFDGDSAWDGVYGPCLVDTVLDLLLDGATGEADFQAD